MLQRIQTVWWAASIILLACTMFLPLFQMDSGQFTTTGCSGLTIVTSIAMLLSAMNISLYKKRMMQIRIGYGLIFLHALIYVFMAAHYHLDGGTRLLPWAGLPLVSLILQILAVRAVKKDEALIRSMNRLR